MEYHLNGRAVQSDLVLPCDPHCLSRAIDPGADLLRIRRKSLQNFPCALRRVRRQLSYDVGDGVLIETAEFLMHIDMEGRIITVDADETHLALAALWVLGAGLSTCAFFRGELPLQGSAVQVDGQMVGILGSPGAGKSTLVWALLRRGALFAADGLLPLRFERGQDGQEGPPEEGLPKEGPPLVIPATSLHPKLPRATLRRHRIALKRCEPVLAGTDGQSPREFWMPVEPHRHATEPARLGALFVLRPDEEAQEAPLACPLAPAAASLMVESSVAGWSFVRRQVGEAQLSAMCRAVSHTVPTYAIRYRKRFDMVAPVIQAMQRVLKAQ